MMKIAIVILSILALAGCQSAAKKALKQFSMPDLPKVPTVASWGKLQIEPEPEPEPLAPPPETKTIQREQVGKDIVVGKAADRIDNTVAHTPVAPAVTVQTDAIRAAVNNAPAQEVVQLILTFEEQVFQRDKRIEEQATRLKTITEKAIAMQKELNRMADRELIWQSRGLSALGIALVLIFASSIIFGASRATWPLAFMGVACFGLAQVVSHPYFAIGAGSLLAASVGWAIYFLWSKSKHESHEKLLQSRETTFFKVIDAIDRVRGNADARTMASLNKNLFDPLRAIMDEADKAIIHDMQGDKKRKR